MLEIRIRDTGVGIAEDRQSAIFEDFGQADSTISRRFGGTGLGLSISRRLTELMSGSLSLESKLGAGDDGHPDAAVPAGATGLAASASKSLADAPARACAPGRPSRCSSSRIWRSIRN